MSLFEFSEEEEFILNGGARTDWKIDCDALTGRDLVSLVRMVRQAVKWYSGVEGIPTGGTRLAEALKPYTNTAGPYLLVDDVLTTGGSMKRAREAIHKKFNISIRERPNFVQGLVIFARGPCPHWITALYQAHPSLWLSQSGGQKDFIVSKN